MQGRMASAKGYGRGYVLGPSPVPPIYLADSYSCVPRDTTHALSRASRCGGAHPTSPLGARFAYPVHALESLDWQHSSCPAQWSKLKRGRSAQDSSGDEDDDGDLLPDT